MLSKILQLTVGSRDLSQAEKKVTVVTSSAYFFSEFAQLVTVFFFLSRHKSRDPTVN